MLRILRFNLILLSLWTGICAASSANDSPVERICLYVSSYHAGYHWNDGIERGLVSSLQGVCRLERFYMDTKRNQGAAFAETKAKEAKALIDRQHPDVVIACDDNASKYLVAPYLKDVETPVVFCGVNWTVTEYGYPYSNATGMIEVAPNREVVREARQILGKAGRFAFIAADVPTQHKELDRLGAVASKEKLQLKSFLVKTMAQWQAAFLDAQVSDFVVLGNPVGIPDWDADAAKDLVHQHTQRLTTTFGLYMRPYCVFSMVNTPLEQGQWSGEVARLILSGSSPANIPIITNRRWDLFVNPDLAAKAGVVLPQHILEKAVRIK
jgi:ABC-type uncharacterized transport system substrate-binding protein